MVCFRGFFGFWGFVFLLVFDLNAETKTPGEIVQRMEELMRGQTSVATYEMVIRSRRWNRKNQPDRVA